MIHHKIDLSDVRLHYMTAGEGPPVVLIHGFPQTWYAWRRVIPLLGAHHLVIAPDYLGAGDSSHPQSGYDKRTMAADLRELLDALRIKRAAIVGHDIGMMVAFAFAHAYPDRTSKLIMIDAPLPGISVFRARPG